MPSIAVFLEKQSNKCLYTVFAFYVFFSLNLGGENEAPYVHMFQKYLTQFIWSNETFSSESVSMNSWRTCPREARTWGVEELKDLSVLHCLQEVAQLHDRTAFLTQQLQ